MCRAYSSIMCSTSARMSIVSTVPSPCRESKVSSSRSPAARRGRLALGPVGREVGLRRGRADVVEVAVGAGVAAEQLARPARRDPPPEPPALHLGHVPDQPEQREVRRRHGPGGELLAGEPGALAQQGVPVPVEQRPPGSSPLRATYGPDRAVKAGAVQVMARDEDTSEPLGSDPRAQRSTPDRYHLV